MTQPVITPQTNETSGLTGIGPHSAYCGLSVPADLTGVIEVRLVVHDASAPKTLRVDYHAVARVSAGSIVDITEIAPAYKHASWSAITVDLQLDSGDVVVVFDGIVGTDVDAATIARMVET